MLTLHYNVDTDIVSLEAYDVQDAEYSAPMGTRMVRSIFETGSNSTDGAPFLLVNKIVGIVLRNSKDLNAPPVAGPYLLTQGADAAAGWTGLVNTDTPEMNRLLGIVGFDRGTSSDDPYDLRVAIYYQPIDGSVPPTESEKFTWSVEPPMYRTGEPPANITAEWDSPEALHVAIVAAASAQPALPTPAANGQFLYGNTNRTVFFSSALPATVPLITSGVLTVSGVSTLSGALNVSGAAAFSSTFSASGVSTFSGALNASGAATFTGGLTANTLTGNGAAITGLNASNLATGTVALNRLPAAVIGSSHYKGVWDANTNTPALVSGTGETGGYYAVSVAGVTTLDGVSVWRVSDQVIFDGTRWDKIDGSANALVTVDGVTGDANGNAALPADAAAGTGSKRTLGTGALQAAPGNDTRFPANVTGLRKGAGAGSADAAAMAGTDYLAPNGSGAALTGVVHTHVNGVSNVFTSSGSGVTSTLGSSTGDYLGDVTGQITLSVTGGVVAGGVIGTIALSASLPTGSQRVLTSTISASGGIVDSGHGGTGIQPVITMSVSGSNLVLRVTEDMNSTYGGTFNIRLQYAVILNA